MWTQFCLLIRPEVCTFWNLRRKLLKKGLITCEAEQLLTKLILSRKPKCMEAFYQRQWLYNKVLSVSEQRDLIQQERQLCTWAAGRHQNNYHAWNHRLWLLKHIVSSDADSLLELVNVEFRDVKEWAAVHISEHSGLHYMNKLVEFTIQCSLDGKFELNDAAPYMQKPRDVYAELLKWNKGLITLFPGHEALFYARRSLLLLWRQCSEDNGKNDVEDGILSFTNKPNSENESTKMPISYVFKDIAHKENSIGSSPTNTAERKSKELRDVLNKCSDEPPSIKRTCIENVTSDWSRLVMEERSFAVECIAAADVEHLRRAAHQYQQSVCRMGF